MEVIENTEAEASAPKKPPRKPRPSEIAAKKAKAAAKKKKAVEPKKAKRPAAKKKPSAGKRLIKSAKSLSRKLKTKAKKRPVSTLARLDIRLTKVQRAKVVAKAKKSKRSITSVVLDAIAKLK